jgi:molybdate transport system substrate-binding protein
LSKFLVIALMGLLLVLPFSGCAQEQMEKSLTAFCGSASKPPMEEIGAAFEKETGIRVYFNFGGSGTVLSQMKIAKSGDLYIPGSPDYMVTAEKNGVIEAETVKIVAYLIPAIDVQKGNPKNIHSLSDLAKPGLKLGIGNPETVCVGLYAIELLEYNKLLRDVGKNVVTYAESCDKTATLIALKAVDAVIGWEVFARWHPDAIEAVFLKPGQIPRLAYIPAAVSTFTRDKKSAQRFLDFLVSPQAKEILKKWGYNTTEAEARKYAPNARIGGEYKLPADYEPLAK